MKRRIFLAVLFACLFACAAPAGVARVAGAQDVPDGRVTLEEFKRLRAEGKVLVLDVRYNPETKIKGALIIPLDNLESRMSELPNDREIITYCS